MVDKDEKLTTASARLVVVLALSISSSPPMRANDWHDIVVSLLLPTTSKLPLTEVSKGRIKEVIGCAFMRMYPLTPLYVASADTSHPIQLPWKGVALPDVEVGGDVDDIGVEKTV